MKILKTILASGSVLMLMLAAGGAEVKLKSLELRNGAMLQDNLLTITGRGTTSGGILNQTIALPARITFEMKLLDAPAAGKNMGIACFGEDASRRTFYLNTTQAAVRQVKDGKELFHQIAGKISPELTIGPDAPWYRVEIQMEPENTTFLIDGKEIGQLDMAQVSIKDLFFFGTNLNLQIKNINIINNPNDPTFIVPAAGTVIEKKADEYVILFKGNSITRHGINKNLNWNYEAGMAASSEANDYTHLLGTMIQKSMPDKKVRLVFGKGGRPDIAVKTVEAEKAHRPDLIIVQNGEHSVSPDFQLLFEADFETLLQELKTFPGTPTIISVGVWGMNASGSYQQGYKLVSLIQDSQRKVTEKLNIPFVSVENIAVNPECHGFGTVKGVQVHPNDLGMKGYAEAIFQTYMQLKP